MIKIFKALANADRLRIVEMLYSEPRAMSVDQISRIIGLSQSQTSQHIATLRRAGLIVSRRDGTTIWNTVPDNLVWPLKIFN